MSAERASGGRASRPGTVEPHVTLGGNPAVVLALLGLMALCALLAVMVVTGADHATRVRFRAGPSTAPLPRALVAVQRDEIVMLDPVTGAERKTLIHVRGPGSDAARIQGSR